MNLNPITISLLVKDFLIHCFYYLDDPDSPIWNSTPDENDEKCEKIKKYFKDIMAANDSYKRTGRQATFFLLLSNGIRDAVTERMADSTYEEDSQFETFVANGEIETLFEHLVKTFDGKSDEAESLLNDLEIELCRISIEYQVLIVQMHNSIESEEKNRIESTNKLINQQQALIQQINEEKDRYTKAIDDINNQLAELKTERDTLAEAYNKLSDEIETHSVNLDTKVKETSDKIGIEVNNFKEELNNTEKKMHDSNVTILGIFSAIVLTFSTTVNYFATVIDAFSSSSTYKAVFMILLVGLISSCVLMGLFNYLWKIREKQSLYKISVFKKSSTDSSVITPEPLNTNQGATTDSNLELKPFKISNVLILSLMILVLIAWFLGLVECRDKRINRKENNTSQNSQITESESDFMTSEPYSY